MVTQLSFDTQKQVETYLLEYEAAHPSSSKKPTMKSRRIGRDFAKGMARQWAKGVLTFELDENERLIYIGLRFKETFHV